MSEFKGFNFHWATFRRERIYRHSKLSPWASAAKLIIDKQQQQHYNMTNCMIQSMGSNPSRNENIEFSNASIVALYLFICRRTEHNDNDKGFNYFSSMFHIHGTTTEVEGKPK